MNQQKRAADHLLSYEDFNRFFMLIKRNVNAVRKNLGTFEEPYSEISQNYKNILIKVLLPAVAKRHLKIVASDVLIEIKAEQKTTSEGKSKTFYRAIDLPSTADVKKTHARYAHNTLHIIIPKIAAPI